LLAHNRHSLQLWRKGMHAGCGEVVKEKKSAASFDITAIFLLVMQVVVGGTQSFALDCEALCFSGVRQV
ncbi:conserved hypothetical protein, partial [methanotrophic bacterial endosymbiont of Bathymodiolus sp.]